MLDDYKDMYRISAASIIGWDELDKSELCRLCVESEGTPIYENYLSAVICRYWPLISKFYGVSQNLAEPIDCYDWLINSILYALKHRQWENPEAAIFNDPKGPDKVINRCMKSSRLIHYQFYNRKKRKKEYQLVSIDELFDDDGKFTLELEDESAAINDQDIDACFYIAQLFRQKEYFLSFILDLICYDNVFETDDDAKIRFQLKQLVKKFKQIDMLYIKLFADRYGFSIDEVQQAAILAKNIPESKIKYKIEDILLRLKHSSFIKQLVNGD